MSQIHSTDSHVLIEQVKAASAAWIGHFNAGRVDECIAGYQVESIMEAKPFGTFRGHEEIAGFWRPFVASGASDLIYRNQVLKVIDSRSVTLAADWTMNVGGGVITKELWSLDTDGIWRLAFDAFEVRYRNDAQPQEG